MRKLFYIITLVSFFNLNAQMEVDPDFSNKVKEQIKLIETPEGSMLDPVSVTPNVIWANDKKTFAVVIKVSILEGWHIYAYVPESEPYIQTELRVDLPREVQSIGDWEKPKMKPYDDGVLIYEGDVCFIKYYTITNNSKGEIVAGLNYQACDLYRCYPPIEKVRTFKF